MNFFRRHDDDLSRLISAAARREPAPVAPPDTLDRILARRAAGDRVILPSADPVMPRRHSTVVRVAIAAGLAAIALVPLLAPTGEMVAGDTSGTLRFSPALPMPGDRITVSYEAPATLAQHDVLVLRARYRTTQDEEYRVRGSVVRVAELRKGEDGLYHSAFTLPESAVFAVMVVEDTAATRIDDNDGRAWELLTREPRGTGEVPGFASLEQRKNDHMGRSWTEAHATARRMAELYPDRPQSWGTLHWYDVEVLGEAARDSLVVAMRPRFDILDRELGNRRDVGGDELGAMYFFAGAMRDTVRQEYWRRRLAVDAPRHPLAVQNAVVDMLRDFRRQDSLFFTRAPERVVAAAESLYAQYGPAHRNLAIIGSQAASQSRNPALIHRWSERYLMFDPQDSAVVAAKYTRYPALRDLGLRRLRAMLAAAAAPERRGLTQTAERFAISARARRGMLLGHLGAGLLAAGDTAEGADLLAKSAAAVWNVERFEAASQALLAIGDTVSALPILAKVVVDPLTADSTRRRIADVVPAREAVRWHGLQDSARAVMRDQVLAEGRARQLPERIPLREANGTAARLDALMGGRAGIVVMWSAYCGAAIEDLPELVRFQARMRSQGVPVIVVTDHGLDAHTRRVLGDAGATFPVYHDVSGELKRGLSNFASPVYYVLDREGRMRFAHSMRVDIPRQLAVLGG